MCHFNVAQRTDLTGDLRTRRRYAPTPCRSYTLKGKATRRANGDLPHRHKHLVPRPQPTPQTRQGSRPHTLPTLRHRVRLGIQPKTQQPRSRPHTATRPRRHRHLRKYSDNLPPLQPESWWTTEPTCATPPYRNHRPTRQPHMVTASLWITRPPPP